MRLFVALEIPEAVCENLAAIRENFSSSAPNCAGFRNKIFT